MAERVWLTWEVQRRNRTLSQAVGARLFEVTSVHNRLFRYPGQLLRTLRILRRERPAILFVQNPSILLALLAVSVRRLFCIGTVVMDAHNAGIYPLEGRSRLLNAVARYIFRRADITIVTNRQLAEYVEDNGGNPVVMPDPLPVFGPDNKVTAGTSDGPKRAVFICTWADDEPYEEVLAAAPHFLGRVNFHITGKSIARFPARALPKNVVLTGYLVEQAYVDLLRSADFIIVLTRRENCLNCGAYEAVALEKPLILSDTQALRTYFDSGVVYTRNDEAAIRSAIVSLLQELPTRAAEVRALGARLSSDWAGYLAGLNEQLQRMRHSGMD